MDVFDVDEEGEKVDGSYGGLRSGQWSKVVAFLTSRSMRQWQQDMDTRTKLSTPKSVLWDLIQPTSIANALTSLFKSNVYIVVY